MPTNRLASHWTLHDNESRNEAVQCAKTGHAPRCLSTLHGSESGFPSCFVDSDVVCRRAVWESSALISLCNQPSLRRYAMNLHRAISWLREGRRALFSITCRSKRHGVGSQAVIDDYTHRLFNLFRDLCYCRRHVLGNDDLHASLYPQLVTSVSSVNLVAVQVLENRGDMLDAMSFVHVRDLTLFFNKSDGVLLHFAITPGKNTLHARTTVSHFAI